MKIVVVSDSHGDTSLLRKVQNEMNDADLFIHCGDYCLPEYLMSSWCHVAGNCDWSSDAEKQKNIKLEIGTIHIEHGDSYQAMCNYTNYVSSLGCYIFLSGHTHRKLAQKINNTYSFNPGSLTNPQDGNKGSFLVILINSAKKVLTYKFYDVDLLNDKFSESKFVK